MHPQHIADPVRSAKRDGSVQGAPQRLVDRSASTQGQRIRAATATVGIPPIPTLPGTVAAVARRPTQHSIAEYLSGVNISIVNTSKMDGAIKRRVIIRIGLSSQVYAY